VRDMMYLSLTYDHRLIDGAVAARFVPGFALRTVLGEFADEGLLAGQRVIPAALERAGFKFHHHTVGEALAYVTAPKDL
jgi:NAD dependent epimerase/dehydratase family enzyme